MSLLFSSLIIRFIRMDLELRVLGNRKTTSQKHSGRRCRNVKSCLLKTKDHNLGAVVRPLADRKVQIAVDFLSRKQSHVMDLRKIRSERNTKGHTSEFWKRAPETCFRHLFESTVEIKLPPIKMIDIEGEVIILSAVAGVGQNIPATFGKAQKNVSKEEKHGYQYINFNYSSDSTVEAATCVAAMEKM